MRNKQFIAVSLVSLLTLASCAKKDGGGGGASAPAAEPPPADTTADTSTATTTDVPEKVQPTVFGSVALSIASKDGSDPGIVAGATLSAVGRPEITGLADSNGNFAISGIAPGTVALLVSAETGAGAGAGLVSAASYGLKFDNVVVKAGEAKDLGKNVLKETGAISGKIVFFTNPNNLDVTGSEVFVPGTSFIVKTDSTGSFTLSKLPEGSYSLRAQHEGFAVVDFADVKVVESETTLVGDVALSLSNGPEGGIDVSNATIKTISGKPVKVVTEAGRAIALSLNFDGDAALMKISHEPSFIGREWVPVAKTSQFGEFDSDGAKTIYVTYSDLNGLESSPYKVEFTIDTELPQAAAITILNGWAKTASLTVPIALTASDSGSGIDTIQVRNGDNNFAGGFTELPYSTTFNWPLAATGGASKNVFVRVKDHAGNLSSDIVTSAITKDTSTLIYGKTYTEKVTLEAGQQPYLIDSSATVFAGGLEIKPGVTLKISGLTTLTINGVFNAVGSSAVGTAGAITIESVGGAYPRDCDTDNSPVLQASDAPPGGTVATHLKNVHFKRMRGIALNGGLVENNHFDDGVCDLTKNVVYFGSLSKTGFDALTVRNNTFTTYRVALGVSQGNDNTIFTGNQGTVVSTLCVVAPATGVTFTGNDFTGLSYDGRGMLEISVCPNNPTDYTGNIFRGNSTVVYASGGRTADLTVSGLDVRGCDSIAFNGNTNPPSNLTIQDSTFTGCKTAVKHQGAMPSATAKNIFFYDNEIAVSEALVQSENTSSPNPVFEYNKIDCISGTNKFCDLLYVSDLGGAVSNAAGSLVMHHNDVSCPKVSATEGCRGFSLVDTGGISNLSIAQLDITDNYWGRGLQLSTNLNSAGNINLMEYPTVSPIDAFRTEIEIYKVVANGSAGGLGAYMNVTAVPTGLIAREGTATGTGPR